MFADIPLAAQIDGAEARLSAAIANFVRATHAHADCSVIPVCGGLAVYVSPSSPMNKIIGMALGTAFDVKALEPIEREWQRKGEPVRVELSILADPSVGGLLTERGYRLHGFENVLGLPLDHMPPSSLPADIVVEIAREDQLTQWNDIALDAFMNLDGTGSAADDGFSRAQLATALEPLARAPGFTRYLALLNGEPVGEAAMRIDGSLAQLAGAGTLPHARGRGIQKALLHQRLSDARRAGCTLAVVTTSPGTRSQGNVMRRGFELLYARAILIRG